MSYEIRKMSAVTRKSSSSVSQPSRLTRTSDGARSKQSTTVASSSRRGAKPASSETATQDTKTSAAVLSRKTASKRQASGNLEAKEDEYRFVSKILYVCV